MLVLWYLCVMYVIGDPLFEKFQWFWLDFVNEPALCLHLRQETGNRRNAISTLADFVKIRHVQQSTHELRDQR